MFRATCFAVLRLYFSKRSDTALSFGVIVGSTSQTAVLMLHRPLHFKAVLDIRFRQMSLTARLWYCEITSCFDVIVKYLRDV